MLVVPCIGRGVGPGVGVKVGKKGRVGVAVGVATGRVVAVAVTVGGGELTGVTINGCVQLASIDTSRTENAVRKLRKRVTIGLLRAACRAVIGFQQ